MIADPGNSVLQAQVGASACKIGRSSTGLVKASVRQLLPPPLDSEVAAAAAADINARQKGVARACEVEGWMYKQGDWRNPAFKRRWFLLKEHENCAMGWKLTYFKAQDDGDGTVLPQVTRKYKDTFSLRLVLCTPTCVCHLRPLSAWSITCSHVSKPSGLTAGEGHKG